MLIILITAILALLFYYVIVKPFSFWKDRGVKQGNPKWIVGDNWGMISRQQSVADMVQKTYNQCQGLRYSGIYQFFTPTLIISDLDLIKQITVKDFDHFTDHRTVVPEDVDPLVAKNLVALKGQKWRDMRAILSPSFTSAKMKSMFLLISECSENFVQHFLKKNEDVITIEYKDTFTRFTNDVIATAAFGIQVDSLSHPNNRFYLMGKEATNFASARKMLKALVYILFPKIYNMLKLQVFSAEVSNFFKELVTDSIRVREEQGIVRHDMINLLLEARKGIHKQEDSDIIDMGFSTAKETDLGKPKTPKEITDMDITAQAMIFFLAGFDTVSSLMCFLSYELTVNPDIQDRLRHDIRSTLEECDGKLTYEYLLKMKYLDMVVAETLRKWPIAVATDRVCTKPYTIEPMASDEKPIHLKKGDSLWFPIFGIHHDPKYFLDPERFDPERFSDENKSKINPYTYFPFGLGPRNCIGSRFALMEIKTLIFHILNHFELVPVEKSRIPLELSKKEFNLTADGGFWFGLKHIKTEP